MRWTARAKAFSVVAATLILTSFGIVGSVGEVGEDEATEAIEGTSFGLIAAEDALELLRAKANDPGFVLLDVRTPAEVAAAHIPGASQLDFRDPAFVDALRKLDRDVTYLIYCRTANRTGQAWRIMGDLGFDKVYDLGGGITRWIELGYPVCVGEIDGDHVCQVEAYAERTSHDAGHDDVETAPRT